jgi:hypothetical protein
VIGRYRHAFQWGKLHGGDEGALTDHQKSGRTRAPAVKFDGLHPKILVIPDETGFLESQAVLSKAII